MKTLLIIVVGFLIGFFAGFRWNDSYYANLKQKLTQLTETEMDEYLSLKSQEAKFRKADEILGKAIMIFLADLGLRLSDDKVAFAKNAINRLPVVEPKESPKLPQPLPVESSPAEDLPKIERQDQATRTKDPTANGGSFLSVNQRLKRAAPQAVNGVVGRILYTGPVPRAEIIKMNADPVCAKLNADKAVFKEDLLVNPDNSLRNVFIYIKDELPAELIPPISTKPVKFDQTGCRYVPHVLGVRVGQPFQIFNSDPLLHNVHSMAKINSSFNMGMAARGQMIEKKFTKPEVMVKIKCDVHGWMNAYVGVLEHPYFAVSDEEGHFVIPNIPRGQYTLEAWHEKLGTKSQMFGISEQGVLPVSISF